jgi:hypothetical protein
MPTGTYGQFSAKASVRLPTDAYGTTYYDNGLRYPSTMVHQSSVTPAVPRGQLPRQIQPTPVSATIPTRWCSAVAVQLNQPLSRRPVPTVVLSGQPHKGTPEALAKFSSQSCFAAFQRQRAPTVPRDQLPRSSSTVYHPSGPTPVSATVPNDRRPTATAQASQPLCRQLVPTVVSSGPPIKGMPEALAKFSSQSCITEISRTASNGTTAKQPQYDSPRLHRARQAQADARNRFLWQLWSYSRTPTNGTEPVAISTSVPNGPTTAAPNVTVRASNRINDPIVIDTEQATPTAAATTPGEPTCHLECTPVIASVPTGPHLEAITGLPRDDCDDDDGSTILFMPDMLFANREPTLPECSTGNAVPIHPTGNCFDDDASDILFCLTYCSPTTVSPLYATTMGSPQQQQPIQMPSLPPNLMLRIWTSSLCQISCLPLMGSIQQLQFLWLPTPLLGPPFQLMMPQTSCSCLT